MLIWQCLCFCTSLVCVSRCKSSQGPAVQSCGDEWTEAVFKTQIQLPASEEIGSEPYVT